MLGQHKKNTVPGWGVILMAFVLVLVATSIFMRMVNGGMNANLLEGWLRMPESTQSLAQPSVQVLRAAKPDFTGAYVPESTLGNQGFATDVEFPLYDQEPNLHFP